ncbi:MAG: hypothetical protein R6X09_01530 [Bacteroidales bacterium]
MKKSLCFQITLLLLCLGQAFAQEGKHIVGLSSGITMPWDDGVYFDLEPYNTWPDNQLSPAFGLFYEYQLASFFKLGTHFDFERSNFKDDYPFEEGFKGNRFALGLHWIGQYPDKKLQAELGGFFNVAFATCKEWDADVKGIEYGIIVGPAYSFGNIKIALHLQPTFSYLFSNDMPEAVLLMYPRIMCKLHYTLN